MMGKGDYEEPTQMHIYDEIIYRPGNIQLPSSRNQHRSGNVQLPNTTSQEKVQEKRCGLYILVLLSIIVSAGVSVPVTYFVTKEKYIHNKSWTTWGSWTDCSVTCDTGIQYRQKQLCGNTGTCTNETIDTRTCFQQRCPESVTTWGFWTDCTVTCGTGIQHRHRQLCSNTGTCINETTDTRTCFQQRCPDFWTAWCSWTDCTMTCGTGIQHRHRQLCGNTGTCTNETTDTRACFQQQCPESWTTWGSWTDCTVTCDTGIQHRHRQLCGNTGMCTNETADTRTCFQQRCPDFWTTWGSWTDCTVTCGTGIQQRQRQLCRKTGTCTSETTDKRTCFQQQCPVEKFRFSMKFDPSTLCRWRYLSPDNTILSNKYSSLTPNSPDGVNQLKNYQGAIADVCFGKNARIYYEVAYEYTITNTLEDMYWLLFDIGLAERGKIDNYYESGNANVSGWSFSLTNYKERNKVYLIADHLSSWEQSTEFSDNTAGTFKNGTFGVFIDRLKNEFSLVNNDNIFYTFKNVTSLVNLCPVFAVYNSRKADVRLQILNAHNLTDLPFI